MNKLETLEKLEDSESSQICFVNGQFQNGNYDLQDMYGERGHLETLDNTRGKIQALREDLCMTPKEWEEIRNWHDPSYAMVNK